MILREVIEFFVMVDLDGGSIRLIDDVFCDIWKVLWVHNDLLEVLVLAVYSIDQIYIAVFGNTFDLNHNFG